MTHIQVTIRHAIPNRINRTLNRFELFIREVSEYEEEDQISVMGSWRTAEEAAAEAAKIINKFYGIESSNTDEALKGRNPESL